VSDRDSRFQAHFFWQPLQKAFGTKLKFSSSYHLEIDGQIERVNKILEDKLSACVLEFQGIWEMTYHWWNFLITIVTNLPLK